MGLGNTRRFGKIYFEKDNKMKIALCLHGLVGTTEKYGGGEQEINYKIAHKHFKKHVFDKNDEVDVFMHTWSTEYHERLKQAYNPVEIMSEEQPNYDSDVRRQSIFCRWDSAQKAIKLVEKQDKKYDCVLLTRYDIAFCSDFVFKECDIEKFYAQGPPGPQQGGINLINDLWFFSNQENMSKFTTLKDYLEEPPYNEHLDSNHELSRIHLHRTGLQDKLEYVFKRDWNGRVGKITTETPLVRWLYYSKG